MNRVTGIGGIFFKCPDAAATKAWYARHLGIPESNYGHMFQWENPEGQVGSTTWSPFSSKSTYFGDGPQEFMINYRVENLEALVETLRAEGVTIAGGVDSFDYGKFAWIIDCDGRRVELWEPVDHALTE